MSCPRVLVVDHTAELGGAELALVRLIDATRSDADVRVLLFAEGPLVGLLRERGVGVDVLTLDPAVGGIDRHSAGRIGSGVLQRAGRIAAFEVALWCCLRRLRPDVVHTTSLKADLLATGPAILAGRRPVWYVHDRIAGDYLPGPLVRLVRAVSRSAAIVIANSQATAGTLPGRPVIAYPGFAPEQGIDPATVTPARDGPPVVTIVGRIGPTKGQLEFVRAAARVLAVHPDARFRIVGAPVFDADEYDAEVRAEAARLGIADRVTFVGHVADTRAELDAATCVVHASGVPEPFGQVVVEAMARGVPVVATAAGGVPEILDTDEPLGSLVPPRDEAALAEAIGRVLADPVAAFDRADRARRSAYERFTVATTARVVSSLWRAVGLRGRQLRPSARPGRPRWGPAEPERRYRSRAAGRWPTRPRRLPGISRGPRS